MPEIDEKTLQDDDVANKAATAAASQVADSIKEGLEAQGAQIAKALATNQPTATPATELDPAKAVTQLTADFQKECENGEYGPALEKAIGRYTNITSQLSKAEQAKLPKLEDDAFYKSAFGQAQRNAKTDHTDIFDKWGDEVNAIIAALPDKNRITQDAWDRAVAEVKTCHIDEILETQAAEREAARVKEFGAPVNTPSGVVFPQGTDTQGLGQDELSVAKACRISPTAYAASKKIYEDEFDHKKGGVRVLPEVHEDDPATHIKPGQF